MYSKFRDVNSIRSVYHAEKKRTRNNLSSDLLEEKIDYRSKLISSAERFRFIVGHESCPGFDEITKSIQAENAVLDIRGCQST